MALWLVSRTDDTDYDETRAIVVRAGSEATALRIATKGYLGEYGDDKWWVADFRGFERDGSNLTVERLEARGPVGLILCDFKAG
ncbi:hypothetical protein [Streptomyces sp. R44]|uniref:Uncharacterized protein n=1 Tax=Streptomyces sp. R44 TaxID=3238633 RepID=A0AB39T990_9ACTN